MCRLEVVDACRATEAATLLTLQAGCLPWKAAGHKWTNQTVLLLILQAGSGGRPPGSGGRHLRGRPLRRRHGGAAGSSGRGGRKCRAPCRQSCGALYIISVLCSLASPGQASTLCGMAVWSFFSWLAHSCDM